MAKKKPKPKKHYKADAATIRARIDEVLAIRNDGAAFDGIQQYSAEKAWGGKPGVGLSERQIRVYMARVDKLLIERSATKRRAIVVLGLGEVAELVNHHPSAARVSEPDLRPRKI